MLNRKTGETVPASVAKESLNKTTEHKEEIEFKQVEEEQKSLIESETSTQRGRRLLGNGSEGKRLSNVESAK